MEVICAGEVNSNQIRNEISSIFVDGFYEWIKFFSKDKEVLKKRSRICLIWMRFTLCLLMIKWRDLHLSVMKM